MQDSLEYLCAQFGYDWTKNKEMVKRAHPDLFSLQKAQPL